ncbi:hypothetical protein SK128_006202 [Halocaridina rubra]|uniref:Uncharacterized protein n=1 Tax=Halocaridina rubra TaxID=373956 RepID=A0AAN8WM40_HALRR
MKSIQTMCWYQRTLLVLLILLKSLASNASQSRVNITKITELSKINTTALSVTLSEIIDPSLYVIVNFLVNGSQYSENTERADDSNQVFEFHLPSELPIYIEEIDLFVIVNILDAEGNKVMAGDAMLTMKKMDSRQVSIVGTDEFELGAYLRVNIGDLNSTVIGEETCIAKNSPCYYRADLPSLGNFKWCTSIQNQAVGGSETVSQCNEEVIPYKGTPGDDDPTLLLIDKDILTIIYKTNLTALEVLTLDPLSGDSWSNLTDITCAIETGQSCNVQVDVPESIMNVNFSIVHVDKEGYVDSSKIYPFEITPVELDYLYNGAVYMRWNSDIFSNYSIPVWDGLDPNNIKLELLVTCGSSEDVECFAYFVRLEENDIVGLHKEGEKNMVAVTVSPP